MIYQFKTTGEFVRQTETVEDMATATDLAKGDITNNLLGKTTAVQQWTFHEDLRQEPKARFNRGDTHA